MQLKKKSVCFSKNVSSDLQVQRLDLGLFRLAAGTSAGSIQQVQKLLKIVGFIRVSEEVWEKVPELKLGPCQFQAEAWSLAVAAAGGAEECRFCRFFHFFLGIQTSR